MSKVVLEDFNEGDGYYKVNLAYLNKKQVEEIEALVSKWKPTDEDIINCIGMCLTDANEQRFKDYGTNLKECLAWLEKQGLSTFDKCHQEGDRIVENSDGTHFNISQLERVAKVEPKFHEGDWITNGNAISHISKIRDDGFYCFDYGPSSDMIQYIDNTYHLWTIADAKEGDVLAFKDDSYILLVKEVHNTIYGMRVSCYCHVLIGKFETVEYQIRVDGLYPATKEQHDLLFQKMKEAGWEWDEEKKELKRMGVVPIFNIGDTIIKKHNSDINDFGSFTITDITGGKYWYNDRIICDITEQDEWELVEQKPVGWSDEDENVLRDIKTAVASYWYEDTENEILDWLGSIKQRIKG